MRKIPLYMCLVIIALGAVGQTSGLQLSVSTGGASGASSMAVTYGSTIDDYAHQVVKLNPNEGDMSNAFSGSGSLPYAFLQKGDANGNYVAVYRSIYGDDSTTWEYDWNTYDVPDGVGANLVLSANNAYSIQGGGSAKNKQSDSAYSDMEIGSGFYPASSVSNYQVTATATTSYANVLQKADYAASSDNIEFSSMGGNGNTAGTGISLWRGEVSKPTTSGYSSSTKAKTQSWATAKRVSASSSCLDGFAENTEGDKANAFISNNDISISNYQLTSTATPSTANVDQKADTITGYSVSAGGYAENIEGDWTSIYLSAYTHGGLSSISNYQLTSTAAASTANVNQNADNIAGYSIYARGTAATDFKDILPIGVDGEGLDVYRQTLSSEEGELAEANMDLYGYSASISNYQTTAYAANSYYANVYQKADTVAGNNMYAYGNAENTEDDYAYIWSDWFGLDSTDFSISNYQINSAAKNYYANVYQKADAFTGGSMYGEGYASNAEEDRAYLNMDIESESGSSISKYQTTSAARSSYANVNQKASVVTDGYMGLYGFARNAEYDSAWLDGSFRNGILNKLAISSYADKTETRSGTTAKTILSAGSEGYLYSEANNYQGDLSVFQVYLNNGAILTPNLYGRSGKKFAETYGSVSDLYGDSASIYTHAYSRILGFQQYPTSIPAVGIKTPVRSAEGQFEAEKTDDTHFGAVSVKTTATNGNSDSSKNDITISASGFGEKTALILDPFCTEFEYWKGGESLYWAMDSLVNSGYAVTYFSDSAVTKEKVNQMDDYRVSVINTHATSKDLYLSKSPDGSNWATMSASELTYGNTNGMALIIGENSFASTKPGTWAAALQNAEVRGGTRDTWSSWYGRHFINRFFEHMADGYTAAEANSYATGYDDVFDEYGNPTGSTMLKPMRLKGNPDYTL